MGLVYDGIAGDPGYGTKKLGLLRVQKNGRNIGRQRLEECRPRFMIAIACPIQTQKKQQIHLGRLER